MAVQSHKGRHYFGENICFFYYFHLAEAGKLTSKDLRARQLGEPCQPGGRAGLAPSVGADSLGDGGDVCGDVPDLGFEGPSESGL